MDRSTTSESRIALRPAVPADAHAVARVHVRSWQSAYRGLLSDEFLAGLRPEDRAGRYTFGDPDPRKPSTIVALDGDAVCGFVTTRIALPTEPGELMALYLDPPYLGRGIGRMLVAAGRAALVSGGHTSAGLWVMKGNARAIRFYELDGWRFTGEEAAAERWGVSTIDLRYTRPL